VIGPCPCTGPGHSSWYGRPVHLGLLAVVMSFAVVAVACSNGGSGQRDEVGASCEVRPGVVCRDQDLQSVSLVDANLSGADFSGSDLTSSDLRNADLRGAKFVGSRLSAVNFSGANLKNADLSRASLFYTNFTDADLTGANTTGMIDCNTIEPDGSLKVGACPPSPASSTPTTRSAVTGPPVIEYFRPKPPARCVNDALGTGIEVEWSTRNATGLTFSVDGIRIDSSSKVRGSRRLPFVCNDKPHIATLLALGPVGPPATVSFAESLTETAPLSPAG
jgi:Pentapeptide repeats (8 copies)